MSNSFFEKYKEKNVFENGKSIEECFKHFDHDDDGVLNLHEFEDVLKSLFTFNENNYFLSSANIQKFFQYYDTNKSNKIELHEFENFWKKTVKQSLFPRSALIVVDVQKDFISGSLALHKCPAREEANEVVPVINELIEKVPFDLVVYTQDWHPKDHISFYENHNLYKISEKSPIQDNIKMFDTVIFKINKSVEETKQTLWPTHCVQMSDGADFDPHLKLVDDDRKLILRKGTVSDVDSYSAFFDNCKLTKTKLDDELKSRGITDLYICGLATDVCVAATAFDGFDLGYRIVIIEDGCKGVDTDGIITAKKKLIKKNAVIVDSKHVLKMVLAEDRRPELGYTTIL